MLLKTELFKARTTAPCLFSQLKKIPRVLLVLFPMKPEGQARQQPPSSVQDPSRSQGRSSSLSASFETQPSFVILEENGDRGDRPLKRRKLFPSHTRTQDRCKESWLLKHNGANTSVRILVPKIFAYIHREPLREEGLPDACIYQAFQSLHNKKKERLQQIPLPVRLAHS